MYDLMIVRVSVLDLDNSVRFSSDMIRRLAGLRITALPKEGTAEINRVLAAIKQC